MRDKKKRLIVIDGNALVHRAYHALPRLTTKKGELVNAVYGFLLVFLKALKELQPNYVVATFDLPSPTFRHKKYKEYKAKRPKVPEEFYQQIPKIKKILKTFGVPIFEKEGYEADDLIGTISGQVKTEPEIETIILSGDLDTLQLVNSHTKVYTLRKGVKDTILYGEKEVEERYQGLTPKQIVDYKGLKGDPSDNIPGVVGIGEKTAIKLIREFGSLENLYREVEDPLSKIPDSIKTKLLKYKDQAFFSKMLVQIKMDVPIEFNLEDSRFGKYDKQKVFQILEDLNFYSLINRLS